MGYELKEVVSDAVLMATRQHRFQWKVKIGGQEMWAKDCPHRKHRRCVHPNSRYHACLFEACPLPKKNMERQQATLLRVKR